jgi:uncharacterized protein YdbL (DUF1318 family)
MEVEAHAKAGNVRNNILDTVNEIVARSRSTQKVATQQQVTKKPVQRAAARK